MNFLKYYYKNIIQYDLLYKFQYKKIQKIPKIQSIILNFGSKNTDVKTLSAAALALELITDKRGKLTVSKKSSVFLKIRKGSPIGCKVILNKIGMYNFLTKILIEIFPRLKHFKTFTVKKNTKMKNSFSYNIKNTLIFFELEKNYSFFNTLPDLNITFVTNSKTEQELFFLLNSFKHPIKMN